MTLPNGGREEGLHIRLSGAQVENKLLRTFLADSEWIVEDYVRLIDAMREAVKLGLTPYADMQEDGTVIVSLDYQDGEGEQHQLPLPEAGFWLATKVSVLARS